MSFGVLNIDVALQISNKILFEEPFGDALRTFCQFLFLVYIDIVLAWIRGLGTVFVKIRFGIGIVFVVWWGIGGTVSMTLEHNEQWFEILSWFKMIERDIK